MKALQLVAFGITALTMTAPAFAQTSPIQQALALAASPQNPDMANFLYHYEGEMMRQGLDLTLARMIEVDPDARKVLAEVLADQENIIAASEISHDISMTRSSETIKPNSDLRQVAIATARAHGYPEEYIKNLQIWRTIGMLNAYVDSPSHARLNIVFSQELLDALGPLFDGIPESSLTPQQLEQKNMTKQLIAGVLGHELGHIHMKHVLTGIVVQTVMEATGKILIPDEAMRKLYYKDLYKGFRVQITSAIDTKSPAGDRLAALMQKKSSVLADTLLKQMAPEQLMGLAIRIQTALGAKVTFRKVPEGIVFEAGEDSPFEKGMVRLTRAQEKTADLWSVLTVGIKAFAGAMAKLAGGRTSDLDDLLQQNQEVEARLKAMGVNPDTLDTNDHPKTVFRIANGYAFLDTPVYKLMSDPVKKAMDLYTKLNLTIAAVKAQPTKTRINMASLQSYSAQLEDAITSEVAAGLNSGKKEYSDKLIEIMDALVQGKVLSTDPKAKSAEIFPLYGKLVAALHTSNSDLAKNLALEIQKRVAVAGTSSQAAPKSSLVQKLTQLNPEQLSCEQVF